MKKRILIIFKFIVVASILYIGSYILYLQFFYNPWIYYYSKELPLQEQPLLPHGDIICRKKPKQFFYETIITPHIMFYKEDENWFVVKQKFDSSLFSSILQKYIIDYSIAHFSFSILPEDYFNNKMNMSDSILFTTLTDKEFDFIMNSLNNTPYAKSLSKNEFNYWVVRKENDSIIGPLSKYEFHNYSINNKFPKSMMLDAY